MGKDKKNKKGIERFSKINLPPETKNGVLIVAFLTLAILSILSYINKAGIFGQYFLKFFTLLFGWGYFLIPLALIFAVVALFKSLHQEFYFTTIIGTSLFLLSFLGLLQIAIKDGGGRVGNLIVFPLIKLLGVYASVIILSALIVIAIIIAFNLSLYKIWLIFKKKNKETEEITDIKISNQIGQIEPADKSNDLSGSLQKNLPIKNASIVLADKKNGATSKIREGKSEERVFSEENYKLPPFDLLEGDKGQPLSGDIKANVNIIKQTLRHFDIDVEMAEVNVGPTVTQYTLRPAQGVKLSKITALQNDLSLALAAHPIRIETPIPGRSLVGMEIPNKVAAKVRLKNLLEANFAENKILPLALGRDVAGNPLYADLAKMPHLLVAGATGAGKTISLNVILMSLLYRHSPKFLKLILIDPKRVEFPIYNDLPHLLSPVIVDSQKTVNVLRWAVKEMERRFEVLSEARSRDIGVYNEKAAKEGTDPLPYLIIAIDELADLMASHGRDVEAAIVRLAQMARAVGIHLVVATQRPSVEVITGLIKANITSRIAFQVASQIDSRTIIDTAGAEKLLGNGDMLFLSGDVSKPRRLQGAYVTDKEIKKVVEFIKEQKGAEYHPDLTSLLQKNAESYSAQNDYEDDFYEEARNTVFLAGKASASLLQRRLRIGYARAARLLDILEQRGIVGPADGAKPREVFNSAVGPSDNSDF